MSDPLLPEITEHLLAAMDGNITPSSLRALAARLIDQVRADEAEKQRARDYVTLWARLMLEDRKHRAALGRAALVVRQRLTDSDVLRITGHVVSLHEWETVKPVPDAYEQGQRDERARIRAGVENIPHEDACCSQGCACQRWDKQESCDLSCNCMVGLIVSEVRAVIDGPPAGRKGTGQAGHRSTEGRLPRRRRCVMVLLRRFWRWWNQPILVITIRREKGGA